MRRRTTTLALAATVLFLVGCERGGADRAGEEQAMDEARVEEGLGVLRVMNQASEPVAIHLDGREIYSVPPGRA